MLYHSLSHFEKFEMRISTLLHWNKWKSDVYMVFDVKIWFDKIPEKKFWTNIYPTLSNYPVFSICMQLHYSTSVQIDNIWTNILCKTSTRVMIKMSIGIDRLRWVTNNGIFHLIFFIQSDLWCHPWHFAPSKDFHSPLFSWPFILKFLLIYDVLFSNQQLAVCLRSRRTSTHSNRHKMQTNIFLMHNLHLYIHGKGITAPTIRIPALRGRISCLRLMCAYDEAFEHALEINCARFEKR